MARLKLFAPPPRLQNCYNLGKGLTSFNDDHCLIIYPIFFPSFEIVERGQLRLKIWVEEHMSPCPPPLNKPMVLGNIEQPKKVINNFEYNIFSNLNLTVII